MRRAAAFSNACPERLMSIRQIGEASYGRSDDGRANSLKFSDIQNRPVNDLGLPVDVSNYYVGERTVTVNVCFAFLRV